MTSIIDRPSGNPGPDDPTARLAAVPRPGGAPRTPAPWPSYPYARTSGPPFGGHRAPYPQPPFPGPPPVVDPRWPAAAGAPARRQWPRREWIAAGAVGLLFLIVALTALVSAGRTTVPGTVTLHMNNVLPTGSSCIGAGPYSWLGSGTPVTIYDASGDVVGTTTLGTGTATADGSEWSRGYASTCVFRFTLADVPAGDDFYRVAAGSGSSGVTFTGDELREDGAHLSIGD